MKLEDVWRGHGPIAITARTALSPFEALFRFAVRVRGALYDRGSLRAVESSLPIISIGNLSVGGTGKTPFTAWVARELASAGASPAVILRGYGGDEQDVHRALNPAIPVVADADRVSAANEAAELGADIGVLDDGFQHRRLARREDIVLVAAESLSLRRMLPAGQFREPFTALRRATLILITRKSASDADVRHAALLAQQHAPSVPVAVIRLDIGALVRADGNPEVAPAIKGRRLLAICGIGDPASFFAQLREMGADISEQSFGDHHAYSVDDAAKLAQSADGFELVVCTLKDAVKLGRLWPPAAPPLWYVSQRIAVERGQEHVDGVLTRILSARIRAR